MSAGASEPDAAVNRLGRFQRKFQRTLGGSKEREFQKLRSHLVSEIMGRKTAPAAVKPGVTQPKLRPAGLVALEWARLATEV